MRRTKSFAATSCAVAQLSESGVSDPLPPALRAAALPLCKGINILDASRSRDGELTPRLGQGGVAARSRKFRAATLASRRRGGWFNYRLIGGLNQPPRPLHQRWLRGIFLDVASTPPWPGVLPNGLGRANSPPWIRRVAAPRKKISRSLHVGRGRARSASAIARSMKSGSLKPPIICSWTNHPVRSTKGGFAPFA